ncbi:mesoderm posterior protein 1-like [Gavia stellata]|uniref:mesoderm posterior protein 1-like n=1 Tax=Gavia stellata TaxID=37040 RepID=UPI00289ACC97|nr:mesoderm posterior protein 1-like [Gavia stellata]
MALLQDWGCRGPPDPEGYSSSSPAPSPDSCGLSSPATARGPCCGPAAPRLRGGPGGRKGVRGLGPGGPRQSASEREKLRMRRLAQALLRLRHYLPPALAPAGQSLTKIETLRLAIRYIAHLSALLGLSEEVLARRRGVAPQHCPLCPQGLGCCQPPDPRLHSPAPAPQEASPPSTVGWGSPPVVGTPPELHRAAGMGTGAWGSPRYGPTAGTPPEVLGVSDMGTRAWGSPPYIPAMGTPSELYGAVTPNTSSWLSPPHCAGAGAPPDLPGDPLLDAGLMLPELVDAGTVTQELSADLLSLLEALLPPQPQD